MPFVSASVSTDLATAEVDVYYTTSTSGDKHTIKIDRVTVAADTAINSNGTGSATISISYANSALYSNWAVGTGTTTAGATSQTTMTHSNQSKTLTLTIHSATADYIGGGYEAINRTATKSATVTVGPKPSYTVSYSANGGSGAPSNQTKWYNETLALTSSKPSRTNYVFKNWNTNSGGTGTTYNSGANYTSNSGATLYAQWYAPYTVSYNANGGSGAPSNQVKVYGKALTLSTTKPTRTNYVFKEWNTNANGTGTAYASGATYNANANLALYAIWYAPYTVTYNANNGTGAPSAQTKVYNQNLTLSSTKPTRTDYTFKRWNTNTSDTGTAYNSGATYSANANATLYAIWNANVYYNANGGSGAPATQSKVFGTNLTLSTTKPTRSGYVFNSWNTKADGTGTTYASGGTYTSESPVTLYAIWNPIVSYDSNGGTGSPASQTKTYNQTLTLRSETPTRVGYSFASWNTAKNGSGTSYAAGGTVAAATNNSMTLYAQWSKLPDPPTISSLTVVRSNSSGTARDDGTYCKVTARWSIDTVNVSGNTATVTGRIRPGNGSDVAFSFDSGASGTSGTATALVPNCDLDTQYTVTVTVTDRRTSTSRTAVMTRARFILDLKAGGNAIGIGSAAPDSGFELGWPAQFDQAVGMLMGLAVGGDLTVLGSIVTDQLKVFSQTSDVATASSGWVVKTQTAYTYGNVVMVTVTLSPSADVAANTSQGICTLASGFRPRDAHGFADASGMGTISGGGSCTYRNVIALTTSSTVTVGATFVR